ncbi:MAG: hypothetical protein ACE37K_15800 [Planctomycetota bacterium]
MDEFTSGLPFLAREGIREERRERDTHWLWTAGADSVAVEKSWVRFVDVTSDGSLDEVRAGLVFPDSAKDKQLAAMGTACRLVTIASKGQVDPEAVARWLVESQAELAVSSKASLSHTFGRAEVELSLLRVNGVAGAVILLGIHASATQDASVEPPSESTTRMVASEGEGARRSDGAPSHGPRPSVMFVGYQHNVFSVVLREGVAMVELRDLQGTLVDVKRLAADGQFRMRRTPSVITARVWVDDGPFETFRLAQGETQEPFAQRLREEMENRVRNQRRQVVEREWNR